MRVLVHWLVRVGCGKPRTAKHRNTNGLHRRGPRRGLELSRGPRLPHPGFISREVGSSSASSGGNLAPLPTPLPRSSPRSSCVERHRRVGPPTSSFSSSLISLRIIPIWLSRALDPPLPIRFAGRGAARGFCPLFGEPEPSSSFLAPDFRPEGHRIYAYRDTPDLHPTIDR